jgi:hypothetical protein
LNKQEKKTDHHRQKEAKRRRRSKRINLQFGQKLFSYFHIQLFVALLKKKIYKKAKKQRRNESFIELMY